MKRIAAVALMVAGIALPACAQRGASRGGFSGHAGQASRGGFAASAPTRFSGSPGFAVARSAGMARGFQRPAGGSFGARPAYTGTGRYRRPYRPPYRAGVYYGVPGYGVPAWIGPYFPGYPDATGYDDSPASPGYAIGGYDEQPYGQEEPEPLAPYPTAFAPPRPAPESAGEEAVTLVFKDGRPPEQIHNYVLTRTTLYVGDQHYRVIPTDQLDLVETAKVNRDAGVDFQLPGAPR